MKVAILLMNCLIEYVFQIKQFQIYMFFIRLQEKNELKTLTKDISNLIEKNALEISGRITININAVAKNIIYMIKSVSRILLHAVLKIKNFSKYH